MSKVLSPGDVHWAGLVDITLDEGAFNPPLNMLSDDMSPSDSVK
jgi:hypothetical protein